MDRVAGGRGFAFKMSFLVRAKVVLMREDSWKKSSYVIVQFDGLSTVGSVWQIYDTWKDSNVQLEWGKTPLVQLPLTITDGSTDRLTLNLQTCIGEIRNRLSLHSTTVLNLNIIPRYLSQTLSGSCYG